MASNGRTDPKSGMLAFDEETGRKMEAVYLTSEAACEYRKPKPGRSGDEVRQGSDLR
jgi:hypothetical protein